MAGKIKKPNGIWNVNWHWQSTLRNRSTKSKDERIAEGIRLRVEKALSDIQNGYVAIPPDIDPDDFVFYGGQIPDALKAPAPPVDTPLTLTELFAHYDTTVDRQAKGGNTFVTEGIHRGHLLRLLGEHRPVKSIDLEVIRQEYVNVRKLEKKSKNSTKKVGAETIRKELKTLRHIWVVCRRKAGVPADWTLSELRTSFPKSEEKQEFLPYRLAKERVDKGGLSAKEIEAIWAGMFLEETDIRELLEYVRGKEGRGLIAVAALAGVRQREMLRMQTADIDFDGKTLVVRELKKAHRPTTRRIDLHPLLASILHEHLASHPGGVFLFCNEDKTPLTPDRSQTLFELAVRGSRFDKLTGYHKLRHSFCSILCSLGVDQRIVSAYMGHLTREQEERYRHLIPKKECRPIDLMLATMPAPV